MKLNDYQRAILLLYIGLFVYFSIIHVPFKIGKSIIEYDTLFSNKSNLDIARLGLIIFIITILSGLIFLLSKNINYPIKSLINSIKSLPKKTIILCSTIIILIILAVIYSTSQPQTEAVANTDSTVVVADTTVPELTTELLLKLENDAINTRKDTTCTKERTLKNFYSYMKFYYPDWKVSGAPVIKDQGNCIYRIRFATLNPHLLFEREIVIVEISYDDDYVKYYVKVLRGYLH